MIWTIASGFPLWSAILLQPAPPEAIRIEPKLAVGQVLQVRVKRSEEAWGETGNGEFQRSEESEISYRIEVTEIRDRGSLIFKVSYNSLKLKHSQDDGKSWEFDSSKAPGNDAKYRAPLRERLMARREGATGNKVQPGSEMRALLLQPTNFICDGGRIEELDRPAWPNQFQWRFRSPDPLVSHTWWFQSPTAIRRDLELIFCSTIAGLDLVKGKSYRSQEDRWGISFTHTPETYRFEGKEAIEGREAARFSLVEPPRQSPQQYQQPIVSEAKSTGEALVSLDDGVIIRGGVKSDSTLTNLSNGRCNSLSRQVEIVREDPPAPSAR